MVYRVYVEKKQGLDHEAVSLCKEINTFLGIEALTRVRVINRYDVENATEQLFSYATQTVLSEPQLDNVSAELDTDGAIVFAVEYLPVSMTKERTVLRSVCRSFPAATVPRFVPLRCICFTVR